MLLAIDLSWLLCIACLGWAMALMPAATGLPKLSQIPASLAMPGLVVKRRSPFSVILRRIGALLPHGKWSEEFRAAAIYPGSELTVEDFRGVKCLTVIIGAFAAFVLMGELRRFNIWGMVIAAVLGMLVPNLWLRGKIRQRNRAILRLLPEIIDLLTLCVGAGVDFLGALNRVVAVKEYRNEPLIDELSMTLQEMKFGKRKSEALKAMARRIDVAELSSFVRAITQADRMGTPIADVLAVHSEDVRMQRYNRAERAALKAPLKILFPLVFCIMPVVGIIVGGPILLQFARLSPFK